MKSPIDWRRLRLRRADGQVYLNRWGIRTRWGSILLHRITAPDPGTDLHDHPWQFRALILWGGYYELRANVARHVLDETHVEHREHRPGRINSVPLTDCHRIVMLRRWSSWSLVFTGPRDGRTWGFYVPDVTRPTGTRYVKHTEYDGNRRDMFADIQPATRSDDPEARHA